MTLKRRMAQEVTFRIRCSYCGVEMRTTAVMTLDDAARFFERSGWRPHPRSILSCLCYRCATLYPDTIAIDRDIESELPF
jgi:ferredoxin